jgi:hypothetical protein
LVPALVWGRPGRAVQSGAQDFVRVPVCGLIPQYRATIPMPGPDEFSVLRKRLTLAWLPFTGRRADFLRVWANGWAAADCADGLPLGAQLTVGSRQNACRPCTKKYDVPRCPCRDVDIAFLPVRCTLKWPHPSLRPRLAMSKWRQRAIPRERSKAYLRLSCSLSFPRRNDQS